MSVDLPAELSPTRPSTSPAATVRSTLWRAWIAPNDFEMPRISTSGSAELVMAMRPGAGRDRTPRGASPGAAIPRLSLEVLGEELSRVVPGDGKGRGLEPRRAVGPLRPLGHLGRDLELVLDDLGAQLHRKPAVLHWRLGHESAHQALRHQRDGGRRGVESDMHEVARPIGLDPASALER